MPCCQIITTSVEFKVGNIEILKRALEENATNAFQKGSISIGENIVFFRDRFSNQVKIDLKTGKIIANMDNKQLSELSNSIKRSYSTVVIDEIAKKNRWIKKQMGVNHYQLQKF